MNTLIYDLRYGLRMLLKNPGQLVSREDLLPIVWADCVNCVKFPDCDEIPMLLDPTATDPGD